MSFIVGKIDSIDRNNHAGLKRVIYLVKALTFDNWQVSKHWVFYYPGPSREEITVLNYCFSKKDVLIKRSFLIIIILSLQPRPVDFETILEWLRRSPFESHHSHYARIFLSSLDWGVHFSRELNRVERKFPREIHVSVALAIVETFMDSNSPSSTLTKSTSSNYTLTEGFR